LVALLQHAIDSIPAEVFLIGAMRDMLMTNQVASASIAVENDVLRQQVERAAIRGSEGPFSVRQITLTDGTRLAWVIRAASRFDVKTYATLAASRWGLTAKQRAVLALVLEGYSNKQIAAALECAENTIEVHVTAVLRKSGARTRAQVVQRALTLSLQ
jgi:DNA-binding NarL/FixJ family response regulator